jgi:hypothetical protein
MWSRADAALESLAAGRSYKGPRGFWRTRPRGHDKTGAIARRVNWLLTNSTRPLSIICAAADEEQAGLITESMRVEHILNPWLPVNVHKREADGPSGRLKVLSSNAPTSWGKNPDVIIIDEITWWEKRDLWEPLFTSWQKRPGAVLIIITNAGVEGSWQWELRNQFAANPTDWDVDESPIKTWLATWMDRAAIDRMRAAVDPATAARVYDNEWIEPGAMSGYLSREDVYGCERLGKSLGLGRVARGRHGVDYVAGIDYGPKRDRTALVVSHHDHDRRIVLDRVDIWQGCRQTPIQVRAVRDWCDTVNRDFHHPQLVVDPYQLEGLCQDYEYSNVVTRFEARGGKSNYEMAATLRSLVVNRQLVWYPGAGDLVLAGGGVETLADELVRLIMKPTPYGYRFDHETRVIDGRSFHDDRAVAIGMAALFAARNPPAPDFIKPPLYDHGRGRPVLPECRPVQPGRDLWGVSNTGDWTQVE